MRGVVQEGELRVASPALNKMICSFKLHCGATFAIVCLQNVCNVPQRHLSEVWLKDQSDYYLPREFQLENRFGR